MGYKKERDKARDEMISRMRKREKDDKKKKKSREREREGQH
jgi:hypothetical protein